VTIKKDWDKILEGQETPKPGDFGCIEGRSRHRYVAGVCKYCGALQPASTIRKTSTRPSPTRSQVTRTTSSTVSPNVSQKDAREGLSFLILLAQKLLIMRVPDLKPDELSPVERQLLAAALTEELYESTQVRRILAQISGQKKHAKLGMALMVILLPRMKRHGIIPAEMDLDEITGELVQQSVRESASDSSIGPDRTAGEESENSWDTVPVAAGGSPILDRRNGFREVYPSGVASETENLRGDSENENGRDSVAGPSYRPIPSRDEELEIQPHRVTTHTKTGGPEEG